MFPNVLQQEVVNFLNVCEDQKILKNKYLSKAIKKIWMKNSKCHHTVGNDHFGKHVSYFINDIQHRDNGPAFEYDDGYKVWYQFGKLHRTDGPARVNPNGFEEYFINNQQYTEVKFNAFIKTNDSY